ncbi:MAG: hypothetical protein ACR2NZ_15470 [Rubripirellula sp.]
MSRPNLEILAYEETSLGPLCLRRRELLSRPGVVVTEVTLNHEFLMSSYNTDSERAISLRSVELHGGNQLKTLVGGLGLGYTTNELLSNPNVQSVEVVEYLQPVIDWLEQGLIPLSETLQDAEQLTISRGDVYERLMGEPKEQFDLIVIDVDHSPDDRLDEAEHPFYTEAGLAKAKKHLRDGGLLAVWSYAESSDFSEAMQNSFSHVAVEPVTTVNDLVGHEQTDWLFFGHDRGTTKSAAESANR